jgi:predicted MFS family arabinose efflux permease
LRHRGTEKAGTEGAVAFGVTNFAWASSYVLGVPLGGELADPWDDGIFHPFLTAVCLMTLLLLRRVA